MSKQVHLLTTLTRLGPTPVATGELCDMTGWDRKALGAELCVARIRGHITYGGPATQPRSYVVTEAGARWLSTREAIHA